VSEARPSPSIRRRLFVILVPAFLILVGIASALSYALAIKAAGTAYDRVLVDPVLDIAENVRQGEQGPQFNMVKAVQDAILYDHVDSVAFQIRGPDGKIVAGVDDLPARNDLRVGDPTYYDGMRNGEPVRIAAIRTESGFSVQVAETLNKRNRLVQEMLTAQILPTAIMALAALALAWVVVTRGMAPLDRARSEIMQRSAADLRPIDGQNTPAELRPTVDAINHLLSALRDSSAVERRFLANAAHQLRTPLASLQMHLDVMLQRNLDPAVRDEIRAMNDTTVRTSRLANQLLVLAKAEAMADRSLQARQVNLQLLAQDAAQTWVPVAIRKDIDLGFELAEATVVGDAVLLSELFNNPIENALLYTPPGGSATVRCGIADGQPFITVEDTGPGIPPWARELVFERFFRLPGSTGGGAGLGLAVVKEIAEQHGAKVQIDGSARQGSGTCIIVQFARRGA
jgi:two-component system sensor histidine kinase TctE